jgi:NitT/TauT family transport system substrate-binding protein
VDATGTINSVEDLRGQTIYLSGEGATPEFALNYVLQMNGLTPGVDVHLEFRAEMPEIAALLSQGIAEIALLPEPFATTVLMQNDNITRALDLSAEWDAVQPAYRLLMSAVVARREWVDSNPEAVAQLMLEYAASIAYVNANVPSAAQMAVDFGLLPAVPVAQQAIPGMNLTWLTGSEMQSSFTGFLTVLYSENPASVGGRVPSENFFFRP